MAQIHKKRIDENEAERKNEKKVLRKIAVAKDTKRVALGELGNLTDKGKLRRRKVKNVTKKDKNGQKEKSVTFEPLINVKSIKPRVDTRWKNAAKKIVTRSDSRKSTNGTVKLRRRKVENDTKKDKNGKKEKSVTFKPLINLKSIKARVDTRWKNAAKKIVTRSDSKKSTNGTGLNKDAHQIIEEQKVATIRREEEKEITKKKEDSTTSSVVSLFLEDENIEYLYRLEAAFPIRENHLKDQLCVTPKMRSDLIDWINKVHFQLNLAANTYHMTVAIIDTYLQDVKTTLRKNLKLVAVTALFIAAKVEEIYPPKINDFIFITADEYSKERIYAVEREIVKTRHFQFGRPLSIHFLRRYVKAAKSIPLCYLMSKYFIELVTLEYSLCHYKPSEVAAASLLLTLFLINEEKVELSSLWARTLKHYTKYSAEHLIPLVKKVACLVREAHLPVSPVVFYTRNAVFIKYESPKFKKVALRPELRGSRIRQLCAK